MVYQLSEKNQILVALFAIVILCAGKLFKDYLFRQGYIEGLQVTTETSTQLRRKHVNDTKLSGNENITSATTRNTVTASLDFLVKLGEDMVKSSSISNVLVVNCPDNVTDVVTLPVSTSNVYASVTGATGATFDTPSVSGRVITLSLASDSTIKKDTLIKITISGISIIPSVNSSDIPPSNNYDINFTVALKVSSGGATKETTDRTVRILPALAGTASDFVSPTAATSSEIQEAINGINTRLADATSNGPSRSEKEYLLKARSALVTLLASTYGTVKEAGQVFDSDALYEAQRTAIDFIKNEKERAKNNAEALKQDNTNKRRMAQINTYYTRNYEANTEVMKNIIFVSIAIIVLAVLRNKELIPSSIATLGVIFVLTLGGIVIGKQVIDIMWRDDHDFDKYNWAFNEDEVNRKQLVQQNADPSNLSEMGMGMAPCYGPGCCDVGTTWDNSAKKCIPGVGRIYDSSAKWTSAANGTVTISFKSKNALSSSPTADKVYITLPDGLFTTMSTTTAPSGFSWTNPSVTAPIELTVTTSIAADTAITIALTGLTISTSQYSISKTLKVKTSKDISEVPIEITDIPSTIK